MANKKIYLDFYDKTLVDSSGNPAISDQKPSILYEAYEKWEHKFLTGSTPVNVSDAVSWSFAIDSDFVHENMPGALNAGLSGAITAIPVKSLTEAPPTSGIVHLTNGSDETEEITYSSWTLNTGVYTLVVATTLTYVYLTNDVVEIENTAPMVRVNNTDIDSSQAASGIIIPQLDADTITFLDRIGEEDEIDCYARLRGYNALGKPIYNYRYSIIAQNDIDPGSASPAGPAGKFYDKGASDGRFEKIISGTQTTLTDNATTNIVIYDKTLAGAADVFMKMVGAAGARVYGMKLGHFGSTAYNDGGSYMELGTALGGTITIACDISSNDVRLNITLASVGENLKLVHRSKQLTLES